MRKYLRQLGRSLAMNARLYFTIRKRVKEVKRLRMANIGSGTHDPSITYKVDAVITVKNLLYCAGVAADSIAACGVSDVPFGTVDDTADAIGDYVAVNLIGKGPTKTMVCSGAITRGNLVYVGAAGKVASSGTQIVGVALTATTTNGDELEVLDLLPGSATPGIPASLVDANTVIYGVTDNTPAALAMAASTFVARLTAGNIVAATVTEVLTELGGNSAPTGTGKVVLQGTPTLTTPVIGAATGTSLVTTAGIGSSGPTGLGLGYRTGAGGAVAQATDRTTGVTLNTLSGKITTQATSLAAQTSVSFTLTNSTIAVGDNVQVNVRSGSTGNKTIAAVNVVAAGSCLITLFNTDASVADTGAAILNFSVWKAVEA